LMSDLYRRFLKPDADDAHLLRFVRVTTVVLGLLGTGMALLMLSIKSALDAWWGMAGIFSGGMLGLFLLGIVSARVRWPHALIAVILGILLILWGSFGPETGSPWAFPFHTLMITVIGTVAIFLVGILLSFPHKK